jgi:hypothetical protein
MEEIAAANGDFKATFEKQQEIIADWIVSQKAFRELALDFGEQLGLSKDEIREKYTKAQADVLNNETKHGNNSSEATKPNILVTLTDQSISKQKEKLSLK